MSRVNDVGGQTGFGPLPKQPDDAPQFQADWEARVFALFVVLSARKVIRNSDEMRDAVERIPPSRYLTSSYFERWFLAEQMLVCEKRLLPGVPSTELADVAGVGTLAAAADDHADEHASAPIAAEVRRFEQQLTDAGIVTDTELDEALDRLLDRASPVVGAQLIAKAWLNPEFKSNLLSDANAVMRDLGLYIGSGAHEYKFRVVENTPLTHNVVVCTLCSCYPGFLLGPSPSWYKSDTYRARVVREPRAVLDEFGLELDHDVRITVWDSIAENRYMVMPQRPPGTQDLDEEQLARLVTRSGMIGTAAL